MSLLAQKASNIFPFIAIFTFFCVAGKADKIEILSQKCAVTKYFFLINSCEKKLPSNRKIPSFDYHVLWKFDGVENAMIMFYGS